MRGGAHSGSVACEKGTIWLSWRGSKDVILEAGQRLAIRRARALLIQALRGEAALKIER